MKNLIDKYKESIFNIGTAYFDLSGQINNDRIILNLYKSEFKNGLSVGLVLNLSSLEISTFGKSGSDLNFKKFDGSSLILCDGTEYQFANNVNHQLGARIEALEEDEGYKIKYVNSNLEEYYYVDNTNVLDRTYSLLKVRDKKKEEDIYTYTYINGNINTITNRLFKKEENGNTVYDNEEINYYYNENNNCRFIAIYRDSFVLKTITFEYDENQFVKKITIHKNQSNSFLLEQEYEITKTDEEITFKDCLTNLSKSFVLDNFGNFNGSITDEYGTITNIIDGVVTPYYNKITSETEREKIRVKYHFDSNNRVCDIEGYNKIHSIRKYQDNKLLLSCDGCFKDVRYLGNQVTSYFISCTFDSNQIITSDDESNYINGLKPGSLFMMDLNVENRVILNYRNLKKKAYTGILVFENITIDKTKILITYYENQEFVKEEYYDVSGKCFAFPIYLDNDKYSFEIEVYNEELVNEVIRFNAFVIDKCICNKYEYNEDDELISKIENGKEVLIHTINDSNILLNETGITSFTKGGKLSGLINETGVVTFNEFNEDDQLIKKTIKLNNEVINEEVKTYDERKLLKTVTSSSSNITTTYNYNNDYSVSNVVNGSDKIEYIKDNEKPLLSKINYKNINNNTILKSHGFNYDDAYSLTQLKENEVDKYQYVYDEYKRIIKVLLNETVIEEYTYDSKFPHLLSTKKINGVEEVYIYDNFENIVKIVRGNDVFDFNYNEDNQLIRVIKNNQLIESYQYNYGRLMSITNNECVIGFVYNEDDVLIDVRTIINNKQDSLTYINSKTNEDSIFKLFKKILMDDENAYGTLFLDQDLISEDNESINTTTALLNKNGLNIFYVKEGSNKDVDRYIMENNLPLISITSDCNKLPKYVKHFTENDTPFTYMFVNKVSSPNTKLFSVSSVYSNSTVFNFEFKLDSEGKLVCPNTASTSVRKQLEVDKLYFYMFEYDGTNFYLRINDEYIWSYRYEPELENISLQLGQPEDENEDNQYGFLIFNVNKKYDVNERRNILDRFNEIINNRLSTEITKEAIVNENVTLIENDIDLNEITFINTNKGRNGITPINEKKTVIDGIDYSYVYDKDLKCVCLNKMSLDYDLGINDKLTISFNAKILNDDEDNTIFVLFDTNKEIAKLHLDKNLGLKLYGVEGFNETINVDPYIWHNYVIILEKSQISSDEACIDYQLYVDGNRKVYQGSDTDLNVLTTNLTLRLNQTNNDIGNTRISSLKYINQVLTNTEINDLINKEKYKIIDSYNALGLIQNKEFRLCGNVIHNHTYQYNNKQLVNRELLKAGQYVYYYDEKNNLISYLTPTYMIDYFYDNRNRLIGDGEPGSEIEYTYDDRDNLTSIYYRETNETRTFTYDTLDRLVSYDGKQVVYNNQNQPLYPTIIQTDNGRIELTWIHNKLVEYKKYVGNTISEYLTFTYNHLGLRTQKINRKLNNKTTNYVYDENNRLIYERTNNQIIKYYYDSNGLLVSFSLNGVMYFYDRDAFLNIKHVFDKNGNVVVSYKCNAYGQDEVVSGPLASTVGIINPFRYKEYYYDVETGLFWLSSRYYSPELGRFIQPADVSSLNPSSINGLNLYSYANNNPIGIAYRSSGANGGMVSSIASSVGGLNSGYHGTISNSSNILGALGTLSTAFGLFDQWSGYLSGGLDAGLAYWGPKGFGFQSLGKYSSALKKFGIGMIIIGNLLSLGSSVYNNFNNPNYSTGEAIGASFMDAAYYTGKGFATYWLGSKVGELAVTVGFAAGSAVLGATVFGTTIGFVGAFAIGGVVAILVGFAGAVAIYYLGEWIDDGWEWLKKQIFE